MDYREFINRLDESADQSIIEEGKKPSDPALILKNTKYIDDKS